MAVPQRVGKRRRNLNTRTTPNLLDVGVDPRGTVTPRRRRYEHVGARHAVRSSCLAMLRLELRTELREKVE
jgi:hypothetical protein